MLSGPGWIGGEQLLHYFITTTLTEKSMSCVFADEHTTLDSLLEDPLDKILEKCDLVRDITNDFDEGIDTFHGRNEVANSLVHLKLFIYGLSWQDVGES